MPPTGGMPLRNLVIISDAPQPFMINRRGDPDRRPVVPFAFMLRIIITIDGIISHAHLRDSVHNRLPFRLSQRATIVQERERLPATKSKPISINRPSLCNPSAAKLYGLRWSDHLQRCFSC